MPSKSSSPKTLLEVLQARFGGPSELDEPRPLEQIVLLILSTGADMRKAHAAMKRLRSEYVDWNEARVTSAYELSRWLKPLGAKIAQEKAEQVKELLTTVYNRFNKLNLDFLGKEAKAAEEARKRERFQTYLQDKSLALHVMMTLHGAERQDIVVTSGLSRALQRLDILNGKTSTVTATRAKLREIYPEDQMISVQWAYYQLVEKHCHPRSPECPDCPALSMCGVGAKEVKKRKIEAAKAAKIAAQRAAVEKKREAAQKKAEAAKLAAEKKREAARKKAEAKRVAA